LLASVIISIGLFFALLIGLETGRRLGRRLNTTSDDSGTGAAERLIFTVLGLIFAFSFSASATRFNDRRKLIVDQANALTTASMRLDVLEAADRIAIRQKMLQWVGEAQNLSPLEDDASTRAATIARAAQLQTDAWHLAAAAVEKKQQPALWALVMTPINDWTNLSSTRQAVDNLDTPRVVIVTLIVLSLIASVLAGFPMSRSSTRSSVLHGIALAASLSFVVLVIFDLDGPRSGFIQVRSIDQTMAHTEQSIKAALEGK